MLALVDCTVFVACTCRGVARGRRPAPDVTILGWHYLATLFGPHHLLGPKMHSIFSEDLFFCSSPTFKHNYHKGCHIIKGDTSKSRPGDTILSNASVHMCSMLLIVWYCLLADPLSRDPLKFEIVAYSHRKLINMCSMYRGPPFYFK